MNQQMTPTTPREAGRPSYDDEISLIDLLLVLVRRRWLIVVVTVLAVLVGGVTAFLKPTTYLYSATIEIGTNLVRGDFRLIETPEVAQVKIQDNYIPHVLNQFYEEHGSSAPSIKVRIPKSSGIIVLESRAQQKHGAIALGVLQKVTDLVREDHDRAVMKHKQLVKNQLHQFEDELGLIREEATFFSQEKTILEESRRFITRQIAELQSGANAKNHATQQLLVDMQLRELQQRLTDNRRVQSEVTEKIFTIQLDLGNFRQTRIVAPPMSSLEPVGTAKSLILVLSIILGLFFGVFSAFIAEFLSKVRAGSKIQRASEAN